MAVKNNLRNIDKKIQVAVAVMDYNGAVKGLLGGESWIKVNTIELLNLKDNWLCFQNICILNCFKYGIFTI